MRLIFMRIILASVKRVLPFDHLRIWINTVFGDSSVISMFRHFLDKIKYSKCVRISIVLLSELIVSVPKTDKCSSDEINDVHNYPGYKYKSGRVSSICMIIQSGAQPVLVA